MEAEGRGAAKEAIGGAVVNSAKNAETNDFHSFKQNEKIKCAKRILKFTVTDVIIEGLQFLPADPTAIAHIPTHSSNPHKVPAAEEDTHREAPPELVPEAVVSKEENSADISEGALELDPTQEDKESSVHELNSTAELLVIPTITENPDQKLQDEHLVIPASTDESNQREHNDSLETPGVNTKEKSSSPPEVNWSLQVGDIIKAGKHPLEWPRLQDTPEKNISAKGDDGAKSDEKTGLIWNDVNHEFTVEYPSSSSSSGATPVFPIVVHISRPSSELLLFQSSALVATGTAIFPAVNSSRNGDTNEPMTAKLSVPDLLFSDEYKENHATKNIKIYICLSWIPPPIENNDVKLSSETNKCELVPTLSAEPDVVSTLRSKVAMLEKTVASLNDQIRSVSPGSLGFLPAAGDESFPLAPQEGDCELPSLNNDAVQNIPISKNYVNNTQDAYQASTMNLDNSQHNMAPQGNFEMPPVEDGNNGLFGDNGDNDEIYDDTSPSPVPAAVDRSMQLRLPLDRLGGNKRPSLSKSSSSYEMSGDKPPRASSQPLKRDRGQSTSSAGNVGTVRALKELAQQRQKLEKALNDIKK